MSVSSRCSSNTQSNKRSEKRHDRSALGVWFRKVSLGSVKKELTVYYYNHLNLHCLCSVSFCLPFFIQAYKSWVSDNEKEGQLPDLNLSVDQLFFIGFATVSYVHIEHYLETTMYYCNKRSAVICSRKTCYMFFILYSILLRLI